MNPRKQIGGAIWLLELLTCSCPKEWDGTNAALVAGGEVVTDAEIALRLSVSTRTVAAWRSRLKKAGLLDWLNKLGVGRMYIVKEGLKWKDPAIQPAKQVFDGKTNGSPNVAPTFLN